MKIKPCRHQWHPLKSFPASSKCYKCNAVKITGSTEINILKVYVLLLTEGSPHVGEFTFCAGVFSSMGKALDYWENYPYRSKFTHHITEKIVDM